MSPLTDACVPSTFEPSTFGLEVLSIEANLVTNYSAVVLEALRFVDEGVELVDASFCNVTVEYTHPGQNDDIFVETWLPTEGWNSRLQAVGGGGWVTGRFPLSYQTMGGALADGFVTVTTDSGLGSAVSPSSWALNSPGNVNLYNLQNLGSVALEEQGLIAKSLIKSFYGKGPEYSYFNGCSQGGRQGLTVAQRYPDLYDGISAGAPAIYLHEVFPYMSFPQQVMSELGSYPYNCELDAITDAAVAACDELDGAKDGVISRSRECFETFDPFSVVGDKVKCPETNGTEMRVSETAAKVVNATWAGMPVRSGRAMYEGLAPGADLTGNKPNSQPGIARTTCTSSGCSGTTNGLGETWMRFFGAQRPDFNVLSLDRQGWDDLVHISNQQFSSLVGSADPDLTRFRKAGGKMITFHGTYDLVIPPASTEKYYNEAAAFNGDIHDFYRYFEVPGLGHCFGRVSGQPNKLMTQLRNWVEKGEAPEASPVKVNSTDGTMHDRILCPYPQVAQLDKDCGDAASADCWHCEGKLSL